MAIIHYILGAEWSLAPVDPCVKFCTLLWGDHGSASPAESLGGVFCSAHFSSQHTTYAHACVPS